MYLLPITYGSGTGNIRGIGGFALAARCFQSPTVLVQGIYTNGTFTTDTTGCFQSPTVLVQGIYRIARGEAMNQKYTSNHLRFWYREYTVALMAMNPEAKPSNHLRFWYREYTGFL